MGSAEARRPKPVRGGAIRTVGGAGGGGSKARCDRDPICSGAAGASAATGSGAGAGSAAIGSRSAATGLAARRRLGGASGRSQTRGSVVPVGLQLGIDVLAGPEPSQQGSRLGRRPGTDIAALPRCGRRRRSRLRLLLARCGSSGCLRRFHAGSRRSCSRSCAVRSVFGGGGRKLDGRLDLHRLDDAPRGRFGEHLERCPGRDDGAGPGGMSVRAVGFVDQARSGDIRLMRSPPLHRLPRRIRRSATSGAHERQRASTVFQQFEHVYCRHDRQKLKVW